MACIVACVLACVMSGIAQPPAPPAPPAPHVIATEDTNLTRLAEFIGEELDVSASDVELELVEIHYALVERNISVLVREHGISILGEYNHEQLLDLIEAASILRRVECRYIGVEDGKFFAIFKSTVLETVDGINFRAVAMVGITGGDEKAEMRFDASLPDGFEPRREGGFLDIVSPEFQIVPTNEFNYLEQLFDDFNEQLAYAGISPDVKF